jgi:hypothetical protein
VNLGQFGGKIPNRSFLFGFRIYRLRYNFMGLIFGMEIHGFSVLVILGCSWPIGLEVQILVVFGGWPNDVLF